MEAEQAICRVEPRFAPLVARHGPCPLPRRDRQTHFEALARAIVFQQLAGKAATTIHGRVRAAVGTPFTPERVLATDPDALAAAGLSGNKRAALLDLAASVLDGRLPIRRLARLPDDEVVEALVEVRGIGRWTAEMFLMFRLGRPDVWPAGDLGVRKGIAVIQGLGEVPAMGAMPEIGAPFAPYRSVAAWYCWRAIEPDSLD